MFFIKFQFDRRIGVSACPAERLLPVLVDDGDHQLLLPAARELGALETPEVGGHKSQV